MLEAIFVASVIGSLHCVAMCGPLISLHGGAHSLRLAIVHALGRLTTYGVLGLLAGAVGRALDLAGDLANVQRTATIVAAVAIVGWGSVQIATALGWWAPRSRAGAPSPAGWQLGRGLLQIRKRQPTLRTWLVGVLTGLLPCGWLWAFVVSAAGTASPWAGAVVMAVFWAGTVPAMTGMLTLAGPMIQRVRRRLPVITGVVLIALGLGTLATRWTDAGTRGIAAPSCHDPERSR
jgi:sulfite exporter TauE/SafE